MVVSSHHNEKDVHHGDDKVSIKLIPFLHTLCHWEQPRMLTLLHTGSNSCRCNWKFFMLNGKLTLHTKTVFIEICQFVSVTNSC